VLSVLSRDVRYRWLLRLLALEMAMVDQAASMADYQLPVDLVVRGPRGRRVRSWSLGEVQV
jgi:hypothetical protein